MSFREKVQVFDEFWLKIFAIIFMTLDHIGVFLQMYGYAPDGSAGATAFLVLRAVGRLAFPLFALMLAEGLHKTHDRVNYLLRIGILFGGILIVEIILSYTSLGSTLEEQAFTDLLLYGLFIYFIERKGFWKLLAAVPLAYILLSYAADVSETYAAAHSLTSVWTSFFPLYLRSAYSLYGFVMFLGFYYVTPIAERLTKAMAGASGISVEEAKKDRSYQSLLNSLAITSLVLSTVIFWAIAKFFPDVDPYSMGMQSYCILAGLFILLYNGKRGFDNKIFRYAEYAYFPVHIAVIAIVFLLISKA